MIDTVDLSEYLRRQLREARETINSQQAEIRRLKEQLRQAQKEAALGR